MQRCIVMRMAAGIDSACQCSYVLKSLAFVVVAFIGPIRDSDYAGLVRVKMCMTLHTSLSILLMQDRHSEDDVDHVRSKEV